LQLNAAEDKATGAISTNAVKVAVPGSNANVSHTIDEDERSEFTSAWCVLVVSA